MTNNGKKPHDTTKVSGLSEPGLAEKRHNANGEEILDRYPMEPPLGYKRTLSLAEQIAQQVRIQKAMALDDVNLQETEEEADDFEVGEDYEPLSPYENDHIPKIAELKKRAAAINAAIRKAQNDKAIEDYKKAHGGLSPTPPVAADPPTEPVIQSDGSELT